MDKHKEHAKQEKAVTLKESEYLKLKEEAARAKEYWDKFVRLQADFENARKRLDREKQESSDLPKRLGLGYLRNFRTLSFLGQDLDLGHSISR